MREVSAAEAQVGTPVLSRRSAGQSTPAVCLRPAIVEAGNGSNAEAAAHGALYFEAVEGLAALLNQYEDPEDARSRLDAEHRFLVAAVSRAAGDMRRRLAYKENPAAWAKIFQDVVKSPFLYKQVVRATDMMEAVARALNERMPGEPFTSAHELLPLGFRAHTVRSAGIGVRHHAFFAYRVLYTTR